MKTLNLMNVKKENVLNRNEMKGIIAGSTEAVAQIHVTV